MKNYGPTEMGNNTVATMGCTERRRKDGQNLLLGPHTRDERRSLDLGRSGSGSDSARNFSSEPLEGFFGVAKKLKNSSLKSDNGFRQAHIKGVP